MAHVKWQDADVVRELLWRRAAYNDAMHSIRLHFKQKIANVSGKLRAQLFSFSFYFHLEVYKNDNLPAELNIALLFKCVQRTLHIPYTARIWAWSWWSWWLWNSDNVIIVFSKACYPNVYSPHWSSESRPSSPKCCSTMTDKMRKSTNLGLISVGFKLFLPIKLFKYFILATFFSHLFI